jgi:hypothetical protein
MKVPTDGTSVYDAQYAYSSANNYRNSFTVDTAIQSSLDSALNHQMYTRLTGTNYLVTNDTAAQASNASARFDTQTGFNTGISTPPTYFAHLFRRAPSFHDVVCYTGTGSSQNVSHNLAAVPELLIIKRRDSTGNWEAAVPSTTAGSFFVGTSGAPISLNTTNGNGGQAAYAWASNTGTATYFNPSGIFWNGNASGGTYVAYLFATCVGVSKVGIYTGNGTTQTIDCGFGASGARFVLIKRTDSTGDWYVYDTARGMTVLTDPYLLLNSTAAQTATLGSVTTVSTGFAVNASVLAAINTNAASYIFLAIA